MSNNYLQDSKGNNSSKRLWGSILMSCGVILSSILFFCSLMINVIDSETAMNIINSFFLAGSVMLGAGVIECFSEKR